jgi:hypothetical protein
MIQSAVVVPTSRDYAGALQKAVTRSAGLTAFGLRSWGSRPRPGSPAEQLGWGGSLYAVVRYAHSTVNESQIAGLTPTIGLTHIDAVANWQIITWRIQPLQICTAGSAGQLRLGPLMRRHWP